MYNAPSPLLLSRTAEAAYWAGRYLERAEGTARLIKTHADLIMDLPRSAGVGWGPLLALVGVDPPLEPLHFDMTEEFVVGHLVSDLSNPSSVRASIAAVHRNLRVTRSVMPVEAAEVLTELHHFVQENANQTLDRRTRNAWLVSVIRSCQTLSGILAETMTHDDAYCFFTVGRRLERVDLTARVLDVQANVLTGHRNAQSGPYSEICWTAALRSVSALQSFRRRGVTSSGTETIAFLLQDPKSPRTVESCLVESSRWLLEVPRHEDAMAACTAIAAKVESVDIDDLVNGGLHAFAEELQEGIAEFHDQIATTWFARAESAVLN